MTLKQKMTFVLLSTPVVLALILTYFSAVKVVAGYNNPKEAIAVSTSNAILDKIDRNFYERFGDVQAFAYNRLAVNMVNPINKGVISPESRENTQNFMNTMTAYYVLYDLMVICDINGKVIMTNNTDKAGNKINTLSLIGKDYSSTEWFNSCTSGSGPEGGAWYSEFSKNEDVAKVYASKGYGMGFAAPIKDDGGKVIGVWYNFANWGEVTQGIRKDAFEKLKITEPEALILIMDKNHKIIDADDETLIDTQTVIDTAKMKTGEASIESGGVTYHSADYINGWAEAKGAYIYKGKNWVALTMIPSHQLGFGTFFSKDLIGLVVLVIVLLIVAIFGSQLFVKSIIHKIENVGSVLVDMTSGKFTKLDTANLNNDEVSKIVRLLNDVTTSLIANKELEQDTKNAAFETNRVLSALAEGDLTQKYSIDTKGDLKVMGESLNKTIEILNTLISTVMANADNIASASVQMSFSAQQLSQGATGQASSVEEISSSMEEMTANIQQNTSNSRQTEKISTQAAVDIIVSKDSVIETVNSMKTIASKISIIGEISRQTNLLALNAAVEAARAGEHGRGFAVVAAEVRKLAERSQLAATEIDEVSAKSVDIAQKSGVMLSDVVPNIQKTSDLVQEITASSVEQSSGADQINSAIQNLNNVVQENAATAEEMAAGAEELNAQAEQLAEAVSFFKIENDSSNRSKKTTLASFKKTNSTSTGNQKSVGAKNGKSSVNIHLGGADSLDNDYQHF